MSQPDSQTIVLITGTNRGIGLALTGLYLARPNHLVIATCRDDGGPAAALRALPAHATSELRIRRLDSTDDGADSLVRSLAPLPRLDIVVANAGGASAFLAARDTPPADVRRDVDVNALAPLALYRACRALLLARAAAAGPPPRLVLVSSSLGSIGDMEGAVPSLSYGVAKAAANYVVRKIHFEEEGWVAFALHPGWIRTANGQSFADAMGVKEPPMELDDCVRKIIGVIDNSTREETSGKFIDATTGNQIAW